MMSPCAVSLAGRQPTRPPDNGPPHDHPGGLWEIWSRFYHHPRPGHRRNVPRYVRDDRRRGDFQPAGKLVPTMLHHLHNGNQLCGVSTLLRGP